MPEASIAGLQPARPGQVLNLLAGQLYFGQSPASLRTLLGSCVALTLWHPTRRLGGMCHFLLPSRPVRSDSGGPDGRYGDDAIGWLVHALASAGTRPSDYHTGLYGGADTLPDAAGVKFNIGERNIEFGWRLIEHHGFDLSEVDVGDSVPRTIELTLATGRVALRRGESTALSRGAAPRAGSAAPANRKPIR